MPDKENASEVEYLSVEEVAKRFGKTGRTIQRWIHSGVFPNHKLTGPFPNSPKLIPLSDVEALEEKLLDLAKK